MAVRPRSRSPVRCGPDGGGGGAWLGLAKGQAVQFFFEVDPLHRGAPLVRAGPATATTGPQLRQTHGWLDGSVCEAFDPRRYNAQNADTWPLVLASRGLQFSTRWGGASQPGPRRVRLAQIRQPCSTPPALSLVLVRWAGEHLIGAGVEGDGGWGRFGCPPSDEYMSAMISTGVYGHPAVGSANGQQCDFEMFSLFVRNSRDLLDAIPMAPWMVAGLRGRKKAAFWMLWPAEWEDGAGADYAGYVDRRAMFAAMRACEAAGLRSNFPHPADLYELVTSKSWLAALALDPKAHMPAAALVAKQSVVSDAGQAARHALTAMEHIRRRTPFPVGPGERAAPSKVNKDGVRKGVAKMGWSWEGRFVLSWEGEAQLAARLTQMLMQPGCVASSCIVQEWVDFDFEMRLYFLPTEAWLPGTRLEPTKVECNSWGGFSSEGRPHTFRKLTYEMALAWWEQDAAALASARAQATEIGQHMLTWLLAMDAQPVPMVRMDFMISRLGLGKARVVFGEFCELGACCLGWENGPPTVWRAALDGALR